MLRLAFFAVYTLTQPYFNQGGDLLSLKQHLVQQPAPPITAYYFNRLPASAEQSLSFFFFVLLALAPLIIFGGKSLRRIGAVCLAGANILLLLLFNAGLLFFLTLALLVLLIDDEAFKRLFGARVGRAAPSRSLKGPVILLTSPLVLFVLLLSVLQIAESAGGVRYLPPALVNLERGFRSFRVVNSYALKPVSTSKRLVLVFEGSRDTEHWQEYNFRFEPGDPAAEPAPPLGPYIPRLPAALWQEVHAGTTKRAALFSTARALLTGNPALTSFLVNNPFPDASPQYVRVLYYSYEFTDNIERETSGMWWRRRLLGLYLPPQKADTNTTD